MNSGSGKMGATPQWGYLKDNVHENNPQTIGELKAAITAKIREIPNFHIVKMYKDKVSTKISKIFFLSMCDVKVFLTFTSLSLALI
jgi:hypothetical protein